MDRRHGQLGGVLLLADGRRSREVEDTGDHEAWGTADRVASGAQGEDGSSSSEECLLQRGETDGTVAGRRRGQGRVLQGGRAAERWLKASCGGGAAGRGGGWTQRSKLAGSQQEHGVRVDRA